MVRQPRSRSVDWLWWATSSGELQPFLDHPDHDQQEIAREKSAVAVQLARLGDPLVDCLAAIAPDVLADALWRLPNPTRTDTLRALRVPPARRPTPAIAEHALKRLRKQTASVRGYTAQVVTLPVLRVLLPATLDTDSGALDGEILESLKTSGFTPDLVRLTALADWGFSCQAAALLRLALTEADLALPGWPADVITDIVAACRRFEDFCRNRLCGGEEPPSPLRSLDDALGRARAAADSITAAVAAGRAPEDADLTMLTHVGPAVTEAREAVGALVGAEPDTLPEDRPGLAATITAHEAAVHARELADVDRFRHLAGPPAHEPAINELRELAADLSERHENWTPDDRRRVCALADLGALIDAIAADRDDGVDELAETVRPHLPDPTIVNAALRGRLSWHRTSAPAPNTEAETTTEAAPSHAPEPLAEPAADTEEPPEAPAAAEIASPETEGTREDRVEPVERDEDEKATSGTDANDTTARTERAERDGQTERTGRPGAAGRNDPADPPPPTGPDPESVALLGELIGRGDYASAHAHAVDDPERLSALRALALADGARSDTGALAMSLRDELDEMAMRSPGHDRATQLLTVAAAARAAVLCGHSTYGLLQEAAAGLSDLPAVATLARHIATGSAQGLLGGSRNLGALAALAEAEEGAATCAADAAEALLHPRHLRFPRATSIAQLWWRPEDGLLGRMLRLAGGNDRRDLEEVAETLRRLTKHHELENRLSAIDEEFRNGKGHRLEGPARRRLLEYARESLGTVGRWVDAMRRVVETEAEAESWIAGPLTDLRHTLIADRPEAERELADLAAHTGDPVAAGAARAAAASLAATLDLLDGRPLTGPEPAPASILGTPPEPTPAADHPTEPPPASAALARTTFDPGLDETPPTALTAARIPPRPTDPPPPDPTAATRLLPPDAH
ncbi:hypothetical protein [Embleya hyalina]|uniref:Uncharacterized protein n=1 Tax=Embleya hyalina TaxID=516124 RepID=A0A401Z4V9_9ACTN|nr:hypothetical protein [Embleya hyalina]GCE01883.1 hypothetical protein EHYA_09657 [Embleya hyalina]